MADEKTSSPRQIFWKMLPFFLPSFLAAFAVGLGWREGWCLCPAGLALYSTWCLRQFRTNSLTANLNFAGLLYLCGMLVGVTLFHTKLETSAFLPGLVLIGYAAIKDRMPGMNTVVLFGAAMILIACALRLTPLDHNTCSAILMVTSALLLIATTHVRKISLSIFLRVPMYYWLGLGILSFVIPINELMQKAALLHAGVTLFMFMGLCRTVVADRGN